MYCPRCGTPNETEDRFCSACGAALQRTDAPAAGRSPVERFGRLFGQTRKTRSVSAATALAILAAVVAFVALKPEDEGIPRDSYTIAADHICLKAKRQIVGAGREGGSSYARNLVPIVANWHSQFDALQVPSDRIEDSERLDAALREVEIEAAALARTAEGGNQARILAVAKRADTATAEVESAIASLGLSECASATIGFSATE